MHDKTRERMKALWMIQLKNSQRIWEYMRRPRDGERGMRQTGSMGYLDPDERKAIESALKGAFE